MRKINIFDTTLRDGEQSAGVNLNLHEKLEIARQLERLGVDIIEAGFPAASKGDFQAVQNFLHKLMRRLLMPLLATTKPVQPTLALEHQPDKRPQ